MSWSKPLFSNFQSMFLVEPTFAARVPFYQTRGANADWHPVLPEPRGTAFDGIFEMASHGAGEHHDTEWRILDIGIYKWRYWDV